MTDDTRIRAALPTIKQASSATAPGSILTSHRGRPAGEGFEEAFSLGPVAQPFAELLGRDIVLLRRRLSDPRLRKSWTPWRRRRAAAGEHPLRQTGEEERPRVRPRLADARRRLRQRRLRHRAPRPCFHGRRRRTSCPPTPVTSWSARWPRSRACSTSPAAPSSPSSAARRSPTRSRSSTRCWRRRHARHRRRHVLHVPGAPRANPWAPRSRRPIGSSAPAAMIAEGRRARRGAAAARGRRVRRPFAERRRPRHRLSATRSPTT